MTMSCVAWEVNSAYFGLLQLPSKLFDFDALNFVSRMKLLPLLLNFRVRLLPLFNFQFGIDEVLAHAMQICRVLRLGTLQAPLKIVMQRIALHR
jgi:hypothetical protein